MASRFLVSTPIPEDWEGGVQYIKQGKKRERGWEMGMWKKGEGTEDEREKKGEGRWSGGVYTSSRSGS